MADFASWASAIPNVSHGDCHGGNILGISAGAGSTGGIVEVEPPDITDPIVDNFVPVAGTQIAASDSIAFDVTDDRGLFSGIFVGVEFVQSGDQEIAHDGTTFTGRYVQASTRVAIANGYRYTLRRLGGWTSAPKIRVWPIDTAGNAV